MFGTDSSIKFCFRIVSRIAYFLFHFRHILEVLESLDLRGELIQGKIVILSGIQTISVAGSTSLKLKIISAPGSRGIHLRLCLVHVRARNNNNKERDETDTQRRR